VVDLYANIFGIVLDTDSAVAAIRPLALETRDEVGAKVWREMNDEAKLAAITQQQQQQQQQQQLPSTGPQQHQHQQSYEHDQASPLGVPPALVLSSAGGGGGEAGGDDGGMHSASAADKFSISWTPRGVPACLFTWLRPVLPVRLCAGTLSYPRLLALWKPIAKRTNERRDARLLNLLLLLLRHCRYRYCTASAKWPLTDDAVGTGRYTATTPAPSSSSANGGHRNNDQQQPTIVAATTSTISTASSQNASAPRVGFALDANRTAIIAGSTTPRVPPPPLPLDNYGDDDDGGGRRSSRRQVELEAAAARVSALPAASALLLVSRLSALRA
jgi:hypothetical protein